MTIFWSVALPIILLIVLGFINEGTEYREQILSAVVAMGILFNGLYGLSFEILLNRNNGIFKILRITPFKTSQFIFLSSLSKVIVSLLTSYVSLIFGIMIFGFDYSILKLILLFPLLVLGILSFCFLGFFIGNIAKVETQVSLIANILAMPMLFLSNSFYTVPESQKVLHFITRINPFNYFIKSIQETLNGTYYILSSAYIILGILALIGFLLAFVTFKWESNSSNVKISKVRAGKN